MENNPNTMRHPAFKAHRPYGKTELAMLYFPNSTPHTALNHLMAWIKRCRPLQEELKRLHYDKLQKCLTPIQVEAIVEAFGEP